MIKKIPDATPIVDNVYDFDPDDQSNKSAPYAHLLRKTGLATLCGQKLLKKGLFRFFEWGKCKDYYSPCPKCWKVIESTNGLGLWMKTAE